MKIDQCAFYAHTNEDADRIKEQFGLLGAQWIRDTVTARSKVIGNGERENVAELQFNYDLGVELEILRYVDGPSWHLTNPLSKNSSFISHIGIHLEDGEPFPEMRHCIMVQETFTLSHTAAYLTTGPAAGRKYHYRIFELSPGSYVKYIKRIHPK